MAIAVLIPAAGKGTRMESEKSKLLLTLGDVPVIVHTLRVFQEAPLVDAVILAVDRDLIPVYQRLCHQYNLTAVKKIIAGGAERQDSVRAMLLEAESAEVVAVHDGARPFLANRDLSNALAIPDGYEGTVLGVPLKDTIKRVDREDRVLETPDRRQFWLAQTPQVFYYRFLREAHERAQEQSLHGTDDAALVEHYGGKVKMIAGSWSNIKLTTPEDLIFGESFLSYIQARRDHGRS